MSGAPERSVLKVTAPLGQLALWSVILASSAGAQSMVALSGFTPGARQLVALDIAGAALGELPAGIKQLNGAMEVVLKDGVHMLRASAPTDFLVQLPEVLPQDFTIEFDFIPKACCNPEDVSFEGTPSKSRDPLTSAHVVWHRDILSVVGGGTMYQAPVSDENKKAWRGKLITLVYSMEGETLKMYTNGKRLYTLNDRKFVRARTLRVFLGGQDEDKHAVYLARLRIATSGQSAVLAMNAPPTGTVNPQPAAVATATTTASAPSGPGATAGPLTGGMPNTPAQTSATQPILTTPTNPLPTVGATSTSTNTSGGSATGKTSLPPRMITVSGFTGTGNQSALASRSIALGGFTAAGGQYTLASRSIPLAGFTAAGSPGVKPRTIVVGGFTGTGPVITVNPRTIAAGGLPGTSASGVLAPRSISLSPFTAVGSVIAIAPRTIRLAGFTAVSGMTVIAPRSIALPGFSSKGSTTAFKPRTLSLSGWTAIGPQKTP